MTFLETTAALILLRCEELLAQRGHKNSLSSYPALGEIVSGLSEEDMKNWALADSPDIQAVRYHNALSLIGGDSSPVMQSLLDLMIALYAYPECGGYLSKYFGYSVSLHLAFLLENESFPPADEILKCAVLAENICYVDRKSSPLQYAELSLDERAMGYLFGSDAVSPLLSDFTTLFDPEADAGLLHDAFVHEKLIEEGVAFFGKGGEAGNRRALQLSGKGGRRFIAKHIAKGISRPFLFLNIADFFREAGKEHLELYRSALGREAVLADAGICFYGITEYFLNGGNDESIRLRRDLELLERTVFLPLLRKGIPLMLCTDTEKALIRSLSAGEYLLLELDSGTDFESRKRLWEGFAAVHGLSLNAERFAMRYRLNASEISSMINGFVERNPVKTGQSGIEVTEEEEALFAKLCIQRAESEEGMNVGRVIYPCVRLEDVKVKPSIRAVLNDAITGIQKSPMVLDAWGLRKNYPYGRSVSILLSGPPGTGKTMTANAIAGELSLPLYQVNLSNIVDKYIGETEKNLEKAFLFAEKTDAVLFFDEADALFGTRSEVHDAKDRYANTEISYLLQRIEAFEGIAVMATNIMGNIDPAFIRRIRYVARFENPDEGLRREIWEGCLTKELPHEEIDLDYLAAQFDSFTGSMIKTVFLNACAYAAGRGETLGMPHLIHAIRHELEKTSTVAFKGDALGKYAYLL